MFLGNNPLHGFNPNKLCALLKIFHYRYSEYYIPFLECLFDSGYIPTNSDKNEVADFFSRRRTENWHIPKPLEDCIHEKVKTLQQICSLCIRSQLRTACQGRSILNSITKLPIPRNLQDFVGLSMKKYLKKIRGDDNRYSLD